MNVNLYLDTESRLEDLLDSRYENYRYNKGLYFSSSTYLIAAVLENGETIHPRIGWVYITVDPRNGKHVYEECTDGVSIKHAILKAGGNPDALAYVAVRHEWGHQGGDSALSEKGVDVTIRVPHGHAVDDAVKRLMSEAAILCREKPITAMHITLDYKDEG